MSTGYSGRVWACPFFHSDSKSLVRCEGGRIQMDDAETFEDYAKKFCTNVDNWRRCSIAAALLRQYDRKEVIEHETVNRK